MPRQSAWSNRLGGCGVLADPEISRLPAGQPTRLFPVSKGGSNTARNLELRCEACNRRKSASVLHASRAGP